MESLQLYLGTFILILLQVLQLAIVVRAVLSFFPIGPDNPLVRILGDVTEPVIAPFRRVIPRIGMFDLSPLAALLVLQVIENVVRSGGRGF